MKVLPSVNNSKSGLPIDSSCKRVLLEYTCSMVWRQSCVRAPSPTAFGSRKTAGFMAAVIFNSTSSCSKSTTWYLSILLGQPTPLLLLQYGCHHVRDKSSDVLSSPELPGPLDQENSCSNLLQASWPSSAHVVQLFGEIAHKSPPGSQLLHQDPQVPLRLFEQPIFLITLSPTRGLGIKACIETDE